MTGAKILNLVSKGILKLVLKIPPLKKIIEFEKKRLRNLYKKENFKPEIKPMIAKLQDELYQLENKQAN